MKIFMGVPFLGGSRALEVSPGTAKRFCPPAQGCRFGYPGYTFEIISINPNGVGSINNRSTHLQRRRRHNPFGVEMLAFIASQGSRGGNPGLEDRTPLGFDIKYFST